MKELTRGTQIGNSCRIRKLYGASHFGVKVMLMYERALGMRNAALEAVLAKAIANNVPLFYPTNGERVTARSFAPGERKAREIAAREEVERIRNRPFLRVRQAG